jgi:lysophospholipase L1-like esterase
MRVIDPSPTVLAVARKRHRFFAVLSVALALGLGLVAVEWGLRRMGAPPPLNDHLDDGMFVYHPRLGWTLRPGWSGRHRNIDFDVLYRINAHGHRGAPAAADQPLGERRIVYLGDSFTFGMGVNDDETFPAVLETSRAIGARHLNFGVPGYSSDQAVLLAEDRVFALSPTIIVLVVYLGNDLLDNLSPYPLQAEFAKPYFVREGDGVVLRGVPVPAQPKPAALRQSFGQAIGAETRAPPGWLGRSELVRRVVSLVPEPDRRAAFAARHAGAVELFAALTRRLAAACRDHDVALVVALLSGKAFVSDPQGLSAQYQDVMRQAVRDRLAGLAIPVIDVAAALRDAHGRGQTNLYHPHEGHLTAAGNRFVADVLAAALATLGRER